jgi:hypothetical protein
MIQPVPHSSEGRFAIVTNVERGMRWTYWNRSALFTRPMRTAKSRGPGIPTLMLSEQNDLLATGAIKPGPWGEREGNRKTIAQGWPVVRPNLW